MSQQTLHSGATAVAEPPAPFLPDGEGESGGADNRRKLLLVGAALGVVLLAVVAFFLLKGGSSSPAAAGGVVAKGHPKAAKPAAAALAPVTLPKRVVTPVGRDPFKALYVAPVAAPAGTTTSTAHGTTSGSAGSTTTGRPTGGTATGTTTGGTTTPAQPTGGTTTGTTTPAAAFQPVSIALVRVSGDTSATFVVTYSNGSRSRLTTFANVHAPTAGGRTTFGGMFALLSIQDGDATVQFGDGTPFDVAPGAGNRHVIG